MASSNLASPRMGAWLIDALLVLGIGMLFHVLGWIVTSAYWLCRDGLFEGQSVGKRLVGLKVVLQPDNRRCTIKGSVIRNVLWLVPIINVLMLITGLYALFNDPQGRHWGDRLADTQVVKA